VNRPVSSAIEILDHLEKIWSKLYDKHLHYRATSIAAYELRECSRQGDLFQHDIVSGEKTGSLGGVMAAINQQFGRSALTSASSLMARARTIPIDITSKGSRNDTGTPLITSRDERRILYLPYLGVI
jgi:hypothetical protein